MMIQHWWSRWSDNPDPVMMPKDDLDWVMIQIQWWWSSSDDPDPVMMIQRWWPRSSDDDPDRVMIQIRWWCPVMIQIKWWSRSDDDVQWWSRSSDNLDPVTMFSDDLDQVMIQSQMKMTYRWRWLWRWWRPDDDLDDTEKRTCADKLCQENTFLVKRESWCKCNFGMYSLVFLIYCNPMFVLGCYHVMSCPYVPIGRINNVNKSCQVIMCNPPII